MRRLLPALTVFLVLSGCSRNGDLSPEDSAVIRSEVEAMLSAMSDAMLAEGVEGWVPFLHPSPEFYWEFHGTRTSYDSLVARGRRESSRFQSIALAWDSIQVQPTAMDRATFFASYVEVVVDTAGQHTILTGSVEANAIKVSGSWRIHSGRAFEEDQTHLNSMDMPGA